MLRRRWRYEDRDEILIKGKVIDFDANPHGAAVRVEVIGYDPKESVDSFLTYL